MYSFYSMFLMQLLPLLRLHLYRLCLCHSLTVHLLDSSDGRDVVDLGAPLVVAVVLSPLGHVPQVLTAPEVVVLIADPSFKERRE